MAYIPKKRVIGLSKLNRVVDYYCRRPQVQERLTENIREKLAEICETEDVAVRINAEHFCVKMRGIQHRHGSTITTSLGGVFLLDDKARSEFLRS